MRKLSTVLALLVPFGFCLALPAPQARADQPPRPAVAAPGELCRDAIDRVERQLGLPSAILHAVALAESGRRDPETRTFGPWPWTINSAGDSAYAQSKLDAIGRVEQLRRAGKSNIDVGCMQINLGWHGDAFPDLESAFDPIENASYAGQFLQQLRNETGSWERAVELYHSRDAERGQAYRQRVMAHLARLQDQPVLLAAAPPVTAQPDLGTMRALNRLSVRATWRWLSPDLAIPSSPSPPLIVAGSPFVTATLEAATNRRQSGTPAGRAAATAPARASRPASKGLPGQDLVTPARPAIFAGPSRSAPGGINGRFFILPLRPGKPG